MEQLFFGVGESANQLGVTMDVIRTLCRTGRVTSEITPGGQWRIPASEIERLKRDGLPPIPRPLPGGEKRPAFASGRGGHPALYGEPSERVIGTAEEVVMLENGVKALGLRRQMEKRLDWFREREARKRAEGERRERIDRDQRAAAAAERQRTDRDNRWLRNALSAVPSEAQNEVDAEIHTAVKATLANVSLGEPDDVVRRLVDAAVARVLKPWRRRREATPVIEEAVRRLLPSQARSYFAPTEWQLRATRLAREAVQALDLGAVSDAEIKAAIEGEASRVALEFGMMSDLPQHLAGATSADLDIARRAMRLYLDGLPAGFPKLLLEQGRDKVLAAVRTGIAERERRAAAAAKQRREEMMRQQDERTRGGVLDGLRWRAVTSGLSSEDQARAVEAAQAALSKLPIGAPLEELQKAGEGAIEAILVAYEQRKTKGKLIEGGLKEIPAHVRRLEREWEFDKPAAALATELEPAIHKQLEREISGREPPDAVAKRVRQLVERELDIDPRSA